MAAASAPVPAASCPVCGDYFLEPPRRCERCDTPHHSECWDYVPGCAIFGCEEQAPPPALSWPWTHRLILARLRLSSTNAHVAHVALVSFMAAVGTGDPPSALITWVTLLLFGLILGLGAQAILEVAYRLSPAHAALTDAVRHGDRRLQGAVERQAGRLVPIPSGLLAWIMGMVMVFPPFFRDVWQVVASGVLLQKKLFIALVCLPLVGAAAGLLVWPVLALVERWIGSQRVLLRRLDAARGLPAKPGKGGG